MTIDASAELDRIYADLDNLQVGASAVMVRVLALNLALAGEPLPFPPESAVPWDRDISGELATNPGPYGAGKDAPLNKSGGWWQRTLDQIDGVTIHHTLSSSPHATASHYIHKSGGRPTIPYTIWVTETGEVLLCVALEQGLWHDHTGHENTHLSVGLAGSLHINQPSRAQLETAAKVCRWAIETLPTVTLQSIKGHDDYTQTLCPGWMSGRRDRWKSRFFDLLEVE